MAILDAHQLEILQHALGLNKYGLADHPSIDDHPVIYEGHRNHFCAGGDDEVICRQLVELGYMREHLRTSWLPYYNCSVTEDGMKAVRDQSPKPPKLTRAQKNYRRFLDADCGVSFGEWLKGWR